MLAAVDPLLSWPASGYALGWYRSSPQRCSANPALPTPVVAASMTPEFLENPLATADPVVLRSDNRKHRLARSEPVLRCTDEVLSDPTRSLIRRLKAARARLRSRKLRSSVRLKSGRWHR